MDLFPNYCLVCDKQISDTSLGSLYCSAECRAVDSSPVICRHEHSHEDAHPVKAPGRPSFTYPSVLAPLQRDDVADGLVDSPLSLGSPLLESQLAGRDDDDVPELDLSSVSDDEFVTSPKFTSGRTVDVYPTAIPPTLWT